MDFLYLNANKKYMSKFKKGLKLRNFHTFLNILRALSYLKFVFLNKFSFMIKLVFQKF